jgi:hypothetical protein
MLRDIGLSRIGGILPPVQRASFVFEIGQGVA